MTLFQPEPSAKAPCTSTTVTALASLVGAAAWAGSVAAADRMAVANRAVWMALRFMINPFVAPRGGRVKSSGIARQLVSVLIISTVYIDIHGLARCEWRADGSNIAH